MGGGGGGEGGKVCTTLQNVVCTTLQNVVLIAAIVATFV